MARRSLLAFGVLLLIAYVVHEGRTVCVHRSLFQLSIEIGGEECSSILPTVPPAPEESVSRIR